MTRACLACVKLPETEGRGIVDERRTEPAERAARSHAD